MVTPQRKKLQRWHQRNTESEERSGEGNAHTATVDMAGKSLRREIQETRARPQAGRKHCQHHAGGSLQYHGLTQTRFGLSNQQHSEGIASIQSRKKEHPD